MVWGFGAGVGGGGWSRLMSIGSGWSGTCGGSLRSLLPENQGGWAVLSVVIVFSEAERPSSATPAQVSAWKLRATRGWQERMVERSRCAAGRLTALTFQGAAGLRLASLFHPTFSAGTLSSVSVALGRRDSVPHPHSTLPCIKKDHSSRHPESLCRRSRPPATPTPQPTQLLGLRSSTRRAF